MMGQFFQKVVPSEDSVKLKKLSCSNAVYVTCFLFTIDGKNFENFSPVHFDRTLYFLEVEGLLKSCMGIMFFVFLFVVSVMKSTRYLSSHDSQ